MPKLILIVSFAPREVEVLLIEIGNKKRTFV